MNEQIIIGLIDLFFFTLILGILFLVKWSLGFEGAVLFGITYIIVNQSIKK